MSFPQIERLLQLDELLRTKQKHTQASLAQALEVSDRTIRNYLDLMRDRFYAPIENNRQQGYYYTDSDWQLPNISLSQGELFALTLGARMLEAYGLGAYIIVVEAGIARLAHGLREECGYVVQCLVVGLVVWGAGADIDLVGLG